MEIQSINLNIVSLKDQQCARIAVSNDCTFKELAVELEKAGIVENNNDFNNWYFLNKFNDEIYQVSNELIRNFPIKNNATLYILDSILTSNSAANFIAMEQELEKLRNENRSLRKAIDLLSRNM